MAMTREQFFECTFQSEQHQETAHVRAWTAADARQMFLALLAEEGIREPGKVAVNPVRAHGAAAAFPALQLRHA